MPRHRHRSAVLRRACRATWSSSAGHHRSPQETWRVQRWRPAREVHWDQEVRWVPEAHSVRVGRLAPSVRSAPPGQWVPGRPRSNWPRSEAEGVRHPAEGTSRPSRSGAPGPPAGTRGSIAAADLLGRVLLVGLPGPASSDPQGRRLARLQDRTRRTPFRPEAWPAGEVAPSRFSVVGPLLPGCGSASCRTARPVSPICQRRGERRVGPLRPPVGHDLPWPPTGASRCPVGHAGHKAEARVRQARAARQAPHAPEPVTAR